MASNDVEVLDPEIPVENQKIQNESAAGSDVNRRHFLTALGLAGAAAGAALVSGKSAEAQQPSNPNGFAQADVINLLLNIKYLKATLYSYVTQGTDLPGASQVTVGTGGLYNAPSAAVKFSNQQITDLFNEMYYDELNQLIALRALQGAAVISRPTINLLGTGPSGSVTGLSATVAYTQAQVISLAQFFEDLRVTAFANAAIYLTGTNLDLCMQAMATDSFHAGAIRLLAIQTGAPYNYQGSENANFTAGAVAGSNVIYGFLSSSTEVEVGFQVTTSATVAFTADTNGNYSGHSAPSYTGYASAAGISGVAIVTAVGAIPSSYATSYTFPDSGQHHDNALYDVPASIAASLQPGMPVYDSGGYFPNPGTYVVSITPGAGYDANGGDVAVSGGANSGTDLAGLSAVGNYTVLVSATSGGHAPGVLSFGTTPITLNTPFPSTGAFTASTIGIVTVDPDAVVPADIGPGVATTGPTVESTSPLNQGFFDTAGAKSSSSGTPAGFAFARTFQQVLAVLYDYSASNPTATQTYEGGFFPVGVGGNITSVI